jgi:hypothetical protein
LTCARLEEPINNVIRVGRAHGPNPNEVTTISGKRRVNSLPGRL